LGKESPILRRVFTEDDLNLSSDTSILLHEPIVPLIEPLSNKPLDFFHVPYMENHQKEFLLFNEVLKPFSHLSESQKQKVFITLTIDKVRKVMLSKEEFLSDNSNNEKRLMYFTMVAFYKKAAENCGFLSKDSNIISFMQDGELQGIFKVATENGNEYYIIDNNSNKLVSLSDYAKDKTLKIEKIFNFNSSLKDGDDIVDMTITDPSHLKDLIEHGVVANRTTVTDSISKAEIFQIQQDYIKQHGDIKLPEDFDEEELSYYSRSLNISEILMGGDNSTTPEALNITDKEAKYLIGMYSESLQRKITIDDLHLDESTRKKLLNAESFILGRTFNYDDLGLKNLTNPIESEDTILTEITALEDTKKVTEKITEKAIEKITENTIPVIEEITENTTPVIEKITETTQTTEELVEYSESIPHLQQYTTKLINKIPSKILASTISTPTNWLIKKKKHKRVKDRNATARAASKITQSIINRTNATDEKLNLLTPKDMRRLRKTLAFKPIEANIKTTTTDSTTNTEEGITAIEEPTTSKQSDIKLLTDILLFDKISIDIDKIKKLVQLLLELRDNSRIHFYIDHKDKLSKLSDILETYSNNDLQDLKKMDYINNVLKYYGVKINFRTDKILGSYRVFNGARVTIRKKSQAIGHKVRFDKANFDGFLGIIKKLPLLTTVKDLIEEDRDTYDTLSFFQDYDKKKEKHHKTQYTGRTVGAALQAVPLIPFNDIIKAILHHNTVSYLTKNNDTMHTRINNTIQLLNSSSLDDEFKEFLIEQINSVLKTKNTHIEIKKLKSEGLCKTYAISSVLAIPLSIASLAGSLTRAISKSIFTTTISIASTSKRYLEDKKLIKEKEYQATQNLYFQLKSMYLAAEKTHDQEKIDIINDIVFNLFNIPSEVFVKMIRTTVVEKKRVKLNLYQPIQ
jgi:hypothetical protein